MGTIATFNFQGELISEKNYDTDSGESLNVLTDKFATLVGDKVADAVELKGGKSCEKENCGRDGVGSILGTAATTGGRL